MDQSDYINKYFEGSLSEEQLNTFNRLLSEDSDFKNEFEFQKELQDTLVLNDREQVKKEIQNWDTTKSKLRFKPWQIAASIIILVGTSWLWYNSIAISNDKLYATYYEPYRNVVQPIVRGDVKTDLKTQAFIAYEAKNYAEALQYFNKLLKENPDETVAFYKANTLMELKDYDTAISILSVNQNIPEMLKAQQQWYLALAYIKTTAYNKAKVILKALIDNGNYKKKEAEQLLKQLTLL